MSSGQSGRLRFIIMLVCLLAVAGTQVAAQSGAAPGYGIGVPGLVPGQDFVAGQVIVGLRRWDKAGTAPGFAVPSGARIAKAIPGSAVLLEFPSEAAALKAITGLLADPNVSFVERNGRISLPPQPRLPQRNGQGPASDRSPGPRAVSGDPGTGFQWHHRVIRKTPNLGALSATPPTVAVMDTGVDYTHSDLAGKVTLGPDCVNNDNDPFDDHFHGTHVAGLVAARAANARYGEGVSPNSRILAIKVLNWAGSGTFFDIAACGMHTGHLAVTNPVTRVGNMSIGGPASALVAQEVDHWRTANKLLVVAAGNENNNGAGTFNIDPDIGLRVQATEQQDCRTFFSNFSPIANPGLFNIAAPGWQIPSTFPDEGYSAISGTSMASPMVAGAAALVWGQNPAFTRDQVIARMVSTGKVISCGLAAATRRVDVRRALFPAVGETPTIGRVLDGASGAPPSPNTVPGLINVRAGTTNLCADPTNRGGSYECFAAPGTSRDIRFTKTAYITNTVRGPVTTLAGLPTGLFTDAVIRARAAGNFQATLDWRNFQPTTAAAGANTRGWELDLGVRLPSGVVMPFGPDGDLLATPFVLVARDSFLDGEPVESLTVGPPAANGIYRIAVDRFSGPAALNLNASGAQVSLFNTATQTHFLNAPACTPANRVWHIANVTKTGNAYAVAIVNACVPAFP